MTLKLTLGWLYQQMGVRKLIAERLLHMPEKALGPWCELLTRTGIPMTSLQWRSVEAKLVEVVYDGLKLPAPEVLQGSVVKM